MKKFRMHLAALMVMLVALGCGGGGKDAASEQPVANAYSSISVSPANVTLGIGGTQQLTVNGVDSAGKSVTVTSGITYVVSGTTFASVSSSGLLSALAIGTDTVTIKVGTLTAVSTVTVIGPYVAVAAGGTHALARKMDGSLWAWGGNQNGQLGDGTRLPRAIPTQVTTSGTNKAPSGGPISAGELHSLAIHAADSAPYAWGSNLNGRLGDGRNADLAVPTKIESTTWSVVSAGGGHSVGVRKDFSLWAWGANPDGQLGMGAGVIDDKSKPTAVLTTLKNWAGAAAGAKHSIAFRQTLGPTTGSPTCTSNVWAWGSNSFGQLGMSAQGPIYIPTCVEFGVAFVATAVSAGESHSAVIRNDGSLWTWGDNQYSQLGRPASVSGDVKDNVPAQVSSSNTACNGTINSNFKWATVSAGADHNLALRTDGSLWSWGFNDYGQLGNGNQSIATEPTQVGCDSDWVAIAAGKYFSLAVKRDGTLYTWGRNFEGQLGNGSVGSGANFVAQPTRIP